jgi:hypothetical protein
MTRTTRASNAYKDGVFEPLDDGGESEVVDTRTKSGYSQQPLLMWLHVAIINL